MTPVVHLEHSWVAANQILQSARLTPCVRVNVSCTGSSPDAQLKVFYLLSYIYSEKYPNVFLHFLLLSQSNRGRGIFTKRCVFCLTILGAGSQRPCGCMHWGPCAASTHGRKRKGKQVHVEEQDHEGQPRLTTTPSNSSSSAEVGACSCEKVLITCQGLFSFSWMSPSRSHLWIKP